MELSVEQVRPGLFCIHSQQLIANKIDSQDDSMDKKEGADKNTFGLSTTNSAECNAVRSLPFKHDLMKKEGVGNPLEGVAFGSFPNQTEKLQITASTLPRYHAAPTDKPMGIAKRSRASGTLIKFNPPTSTDSEVKIYIHLNHAQIFILTFYMYLDFLIGIMMACVIVSLFWFG